MIGVVVLVLAGVAQAQQIDESALRAEIMSGGTAKDFLITDSGAIYVGVLDNGGGRDGYARYVCETVKAHASGSGNRLIKIIDIAAASRGDGFKELGRHRCRL
jgi:hypothetical protein